MRREIIVNRGVGETRAALLEDKKLVELYYERDTGDRLAGNIYKGHVENVLPGMQAAFVNIGLEKNAFLYVDDALASPLLASGNGEKCPARPAESAIHQRRC